VLTFQEPPRTGFEITWSLFGIRFRILPSFFLVSALLAYLFISPLFRDPKTLAIGIVVDVACFFVADILIGLVQGVVYRSYGIRASVLVAEFGPTVYGEHPPPLRIQRIVVALSHPAACFFLFALVYYSNQHFRWSEASVYAWFAYKLLWFVSLALGIIGFLPMFPYPGGKVVMELLTWVSPRHGVAWTLWLSIAIGVVVVGNAVSLLLGRGTFIPYMEILGQINWILIAVFFSLGVLRNWQLLQMVRSQSRRYESDDYGERAPWDR
jgi:hypothetical protein